MVKFDSRKKIFTTTVVCTANIMYFKRSDVIVRFCFDVYYNEDADKRWWGHFNRNDPKKNHQPRRIGILLYYTQLKPLNYGELISIPFAGSQLYRCTHIYIGIYIFFWIIQRFIIYLCRWRGVGEHIRVISLVSSHRTLANHYLTPIGG